MKQENKTRNKLIACLLCLVMIGATLFGTPWFSVQADDTTTSTTGGQSYGAWSEQLVTNGSFEVGYEGMEVYGWHKTAMKQTHGKETEANTAESYCNNFTLTTVAEQNGNKVAALKKDGAGFVAATSEKIEVIGSSEYRLCFDYKTAELILNNNVAATQYYGIRLYVEEWNAEEDVLVSVEDRESAHFYADDANNSNWSTGMVQFKTQEETTHVVVYLWMGGTVNVAPTVYFDNVLLEANDDYQVLNGSFDDVTYLANGGRIAGIAGPTGWGMSDTANGNHYKVTTVSDVSRGNVACMTFADNDKTGGSPTFLSPYIPVEGVNPCTIALDYKLIMEKVEGSTVNPAFTIRVFGYEQVGGNPKPVGKTITNAASTEWTKAVAAFTTSDLTNLSSSTKYIRIGIYVALDSTEASNLTKFELYVDNVVLDVDNESLGYTKSTATSNCVPNTGDYTDNYAIRKVNTEVGYEDAIQLYVTREGGGMGGAAFWSKPLAVIAGQTYKIQFNWKVEGVVERSLGAAVALRYKNINGEYLNANAPTGVLTRGISSNTVDSEGNAIWNTCEVDTIVVPEEATAVEVGFLIGVSTMNYNPDMKHSFANIGFASANDTEYWANYANRSETDLLFKMLEEGNANEELMVDVCDLVRMKKYFSDNTVTIAETADMNKNSVINESNDLRLLRWKLLGVTTTADAQAVQQ